MALEPQTVNVGLIVPNTGDLVDTWGEDATNPDFVAIDGLFAGVQTISATNVPITLTAPDSFVPTPGGGPTQAQNRVLRFTGVLTADVRVTLPLPGAYVIENMTTGNAFVLSFQGMTATEVIGTPRGEILNIYNDGANVRFVGLARMSAMEHWAGISVMPSWVTQCTVKPYLLCDSSGTIYNFSDFPALGNRLLGSFGGNGATTFGVPDMSGRVPLAYDTTAARITVAGCGINGQTIGAGGGTQSQPLAAGNIPTIVSAVGVQITVFARTNQGGFTPNNPPFTTYMDTLQGTGGGGTTSFTYNQSPNCVSSNTGGAGPVHPNIQPSIVTGIWVIKT